MPPTPAATFPTFHSPQRAPPASRFAGLDQPQAVPPVQFPFPTPPPTAPSRSIRPSHRREDATRDLHAGQQAFRDSNHTPRILSDSQDANAGPLFRQSPSTSIVWISIQPRDRNQLQHFLTLNPRVHKTRGICRPPRKVHLFCSLFFLFLIISLKINRPHRFLNVKCRRKKKKKKKKRRQRSIKRSTKLAGRLRQCCLLPLVGPPDITLLNCQ